MKIHKLKLTWLRHREAIVILFCLITVMILGLAFLEYILNCLFN